MQMDLVEKTDWYLQGKIKFIGKRVFGENYIEDIHKNVRIIEDEGL